MRQIAEKLPAAYGATASLKLHDGYPVTVNDPDSVNYAVAAAARIVGEKQVFTDRPPEMGAEDFAFFLEKRPGAYGFIGGGEGADLHNAHYNFNDDIIPIAASWFVSVARDRSQFPFRYLL